MTDSTITTDISVDAVDTQLAANDVTYDYEGSPVLRNINLTLSAGDVLGLVGDNGAGKSTLLWLLSGLGKPRAGKVTHQGARALGSQELSAPFDATGRMLVEEALEPSKRRLAALEQAAEVMAAATTDEAIADADEAYSQALSKVTAHDDWNAERNAEVVLDQLGLMGESQGVPLLSKKVVEFSGGQRARLGLALTFIRKPEILLLDEPTNHLDERGRQLVIKTINDHAGIVVLATHDRDFLDATCTHIGDIIIGRPGVGIFRGNYSDYDRHRKHERQLWEHQWRTEEHERERLTDTIETGARQVSPGRKMQDRNKMAYDRAGGRVERQIARRLRYARQRLNQLEEDGVPKPPALLGFNAPLTKAPAGKRVAAGDDEDFHIKLRNVTIPKRLFVGSVTIRPGHKVVITGPNGAGKTTLLHAITGNVDLESGEVRIGQGARVAMLEQEQVWEDPTKTPLELYNKVSTSASLDFEELGLLSERDSSRPVGKLSVGQQRRVALALIVANPPDVLLLDEPTNHLSVDLIEEVEEAIAMSEGTVVIVTHDRRMIESIEARHLVVRAGEVEELPPGQLPEFEN